MYFTDQGHLRFSPSDLNDFLESEFATWMNRFAAECKRKGIDPILSLKSLGIKDNIKVARDELTDDIELIQKHGQMHEKEWLSFLEKKGAKVGTIPSKDKEESHSLTLQAIQDGLACIYQGYLRADSFAGYADFLYRKEGKSKLGSWYYDVADTKLARKAKPYFLTQLCCYADMLSQIQGFPSPEISVVLGDKSEAKYATSDYFYYYKSIRNAFEKSQKYFDPTVIPSPANSSTWGKWSTVATGILELLDHPSRVARITRNQIRRLGESGILTRTALSKSTKKTVVGIDESVFNRIRRQAQLQIEAVPGKPTPFEVIQPTVERPRLGLALLPPPSSRDIFFDMEGYPMVEGGLEYLFGATTLAKGKYLFTDWWAHDSSQERQSFEAFIDWAYKRWKSDPGMHIYHYAAYETTTLKRLAQQYATREIEIDEFLRNHVFVDMLNVVRQGLIVGTPSYSLKEIEHLYRPPRKTDVQNAAASVVAYENWLDSGESPDWKQSPILKEIRAYNQDDCESLAQLCEWAWKLQKKSKIPFVPPLQKTSEDQAISKPLHASKVLADSLLGKIGLDPKKWDSKERLIGLQAHLLEFHWREAKPVFWRMFNWAAMSEEELVEEFDCLGALRRTKTPLKLEEKRLIGEYSFDPNQATKLGEGSRCKYADEYRRTCTIMYFDPVKGRLWLPAPKSGELPENLSLMPDEYVDSTGIANAVFRYVENASNGKCISRAVDDLINRTPPRIRGRKGKSVISGKGDLQTEVCETISKMDSTTLCIQGPPGTGKTHISAHAIVQLVKQGKSVGVMANSHKAIMNLLRKTDEVARELKIQCPIYKLGGEEDASLPQDTQIIQGEANAYIEKLVGLKSIVIGATAYAFSKPEVEQRFDYLFVDEAGQVSLANLVATGLSCRNLVLIGDQMQLSQPIQGAHPGESGQSGFDYILQGKATIPPDFGVFLDVSYRMHPNICNFISEAVYDRRLHSDSKTKKHLIDISGSKLLDKANGILFMPVEHQHNSQDSAEEAKLVQSLVKDLIGRTAVSKSGKPFKLKLEDILIVAPFNLQVRRLKKDLGENYRIASVDKFQGQEAPVVIISMCASTLDDCPRGAEFLLSRNRLNVAVSRAQCLTVVVGSPGLTFARCNSVENMKLVNLFCWLVHYAGTRNVVE